MISVGIAAGLIAMLCWGIADFLQAIPIRKIGSLKTMFAANVIEIFPPLFILIYLVLSGRFSAGAGTVLVLLAGAFFNFVAVYFFLRSYEIGEVSVVAPISATYSMVTVFLAVLFLNEALSPMKSAAVFLILLGIVLTSTDIRKLRHIHAVSGVRESIVSLVFWGIYFFMIGYASRSTDFLTMFCVTGMFNGMLMIGFPLIRKQHVRKGDLKGLVLIFIVNAFLYTIAWFSINYGILNELVSLVTPVSSLYPAITVLLAVIYFREKLVFNQKFGIGAILVGIFLISM